MYYLPSTNILFYIYGISIIYFLRAQRIKKEISKYSPTEIFLSYEIDDLTINRHEEQQKSKAILILKTFNNTDTLQYIRIEDIEEIRFKDYIDSIELVFKDKDNTKKYILVSIRNFIDLERFTPIEKENVDSMDKI